MPGIRHVSNVQDNLSAMQDLHDQKYHEIMAGIPSRDVVQRFGMTRQALGR